MNIQKTKEEIIKDKLIKINEGIEYTMLMLSMGVENLTNQFFNDSEITAQEFADFLGVQAQEPFGILQATQQFLSTIKPDYTPIKLPEIKWSKEGTVTEIIK